MTHYKKLSSDADLTAAVSIIRSSLESNKSRIIKSAKVGFQGGSPEKDVRWVPRLRFWYVRPDPWPNTKLYWLPFGVVEPKGKSTLHITAEINLGRGRKRQAAGAIICNERGQRYLAHSGRINSKKPWVNQENFLRYCFLRGFRIVELEQKKPVILIGRLDSQISKHMAQFVQLVREFKDSQPSNLPQLTKGSKYKNFQPKFIGKVRHVNTGLKEIEFYHDLVADVLKGLLKPHQCKFDQQNDLVICDEQDRPIIFYEIKTTATSQSIYTGVGQLILNGKSKYKNAKLVLVLPGRPDSVTSNAINSLGIEILSYSWRSKRPFFIGPIPREMRP